MVDAVVQVFSEKLLNALSEQGKIFSEFRQHFVKLQKELLLLQSLLKDAERVKRKNSTLRAVMVNLRDLIYEAEDILADCHCQTTNEGYLNNDRLRCIKPSMLSFKYQTGRSLRDIIEKITAIKQDIATYLGVSINPSQPVDTSNDEMRWSSPVYDHTEVVGLEGDTKKIKEWLLGADDDILAIGFVGMGGLGKTTLAQVIFNDREMDQHFERKIWVSVSQTLTEERILKSILRYLGDSGAADSHGELLKKINQYLMGKRYLLVMDDIWHLKDNWWSKIYAGLPKGNGSSIIITTRQEDIATKMMVKKERIHKPKLLSEDNSWLLFRNIAFAATNKECQDPAIESIGKEIVKRCKGLPLAIKAVGGMMLCKEQSYQEWKRIADHFLDELEENVRLEEHVKSVMASLQLSYDELPSHLKSCFLCFSLYPEDCVITKEQLVHWWIGEGFVPHRKGRSLTEAGEDCFTGLSNRCLIEVVGKTYNGKIHTCKIHDMVRELIIKIAEEDAFFKPKDSNCRRWGIENILAQKTFMENTKLRTLLSTTKTGEVNKIPSTIAKVLCDHPYMRALDLSRSIFEMPLAELLKHVGSLRHLAYFSLSNTHPLTQVPLSVGKLKNLHILDVSYCQNLKVLPPCIVALTNLKVLNVSHCGSLEYLPVGLGQLSNLEVLLGFKPSRSSQLEGCRMVELGNLSQLQKLGLQFTQGDEIGDEDVDVLSSLKELQFLSISCFNSHGSDLIKKLERLSLPGQLYEVALKFYPGKMSPPWLNPITLPMLRYLSISSGNIAKMNQIFWGSQNDVWRIEGLMLEYLSDLVEEWSKFQTVMPQLRTLDVCWCPELKSFPIEDAGFRGGAWKKGRE